MPFRPITDDRISTMLKLYCYHIWIFQYELIMDSVSILMSRLSILIIFSMNFVCSFLNKVQHFIKTKPQNCKIIIARLGLKDVHFAIF